MSRAATAGPAAGTGLLTAGVIDAAGSIELVRLEPPRPANREVRIRVQGCGVCGSDLPLFEGRPWFDYPREPGAPGHETWGVIDAVGADVSELEPGMRVAALSYRGYATHDLADAAAVVPLPPELDGTPFPGEALGCAMNVLARSDIRAGQSVAVVGAGFLGSLLVQLAARAGARVIAVSRRAASLEMARRMGAAEALSFDEATVERVSELAGGALCDRVIEAAGAQEALDLAATLVRVRGRLVVAGFHQDGERRVDMRLWNWNGLDVVNAHEREREVYVAGIRRAVAAVAAGELDPSPLYTHTFGLDELAEALRTAVSRPDGFMKALVLP